MLHPLNQRSPLPMSAKQAYAITLRNRQEQTTYTSVLNAIKKSADSGEFTLTFGINNDAITIALRELDYIVNFHSTVDGSVFMDIDWSNAKDVDCFKRT